MSEHPPTSRLDNDVFAALASQLQYQQQIGGVALSQDQQMLLGTYLAERRDRLKHEAEHGSSDGARSPDSQESSQRSGSKGARNASTTPKTSRTSEADRAEKPRAAERDDAGIRADSKAPTDAAVQTDARTQSTHDVRSDESPRPGATNPTSGTHEVQQKPAERQPSHRAESAESGARERPGTSQEQEKAAKRRSKQRGGGLPSVESFISAKTGRLPWQDPVETKPVVAESEGQSSSAAPADSAVSDSLRSAAESMTASNPEPPTEHDSRGVEASASNPAASRRTASGPASSRRETLEEIRASLGDCTRCGLSESRTNIVFGVGSPNARLMFIGEAPGNQDDENAEPFVGNAGQLLDKMIGAMGLSRSEVYITNILKCRPPDNRIPHGDEVAHCSPFLKRQIHSVDPEVIITLGKFASTYVLGREIGITDDRGRWQEAYGRPVMPTFHPSYLLRSPDAKRDAWRDLQAVMMKLGLDGASS